jgi:hypothetical protein
MKQEKTGFIYIWFDKKRKMYYIGCHWGTEDDGYICSSNRMREAYRRRPNDFKRKIIKTNIEREYLLEEEYKLLSLIKHEELGKKYYNLTKRHFGHWIHDTNKSLSIKDKISKKLKGKKQTSEAISKRMESRKGYTPTLETKEKISKTLKGHKFGMTGKKQSVEAKKNISEAIKKWHMERKMNKETKL